MVYSICTTAVNISVVQSLCFWYIWCFRTFLGFFFLLLFLPGQLYFRPVLLCFLTVQSWERVLFYCHCIAAILCPTVWGYQKIQNSYSYFWGCIILIVNLNCMFVLCYSWVTYDIVPYQSLLVCSSYCSLLNEFDLSDLILCHYSDKTSKRIFIPWKYYKYVTWLWGLHTRIFAPGIPKAVSGHMNNIIIFCDITR